MLSGEALTSIPVEELHDVRALKQCLNQLHGLPPRFRQRVFLRGELLEDTTKLDSPMDLDLVVLAFADVSQSDVDDLILHAEEGIMAEVESKLQLPLNPDSLNSSGFTALQMASGCGHVEIVKLLVEAGAAKDVREIFFRRTELMLASSNGHVEVVRLLMEAGADKDVRDAGADKDVRDDSGRTALMLASSDGLVEVGRLLMEAGADKDVRDDSGYTALMQASSNGHVEVVRLLMEAGADKDVRDNRGYTALVLASSNGHVEVVRLLVEAGADMDVNNELGTTALILASSKCHVEVVRLLLEAGADKDEEDDDGRTALMLASSRGHVEVARLLGGGSSNGHVEAVRLVAESTSPLGWDQRGPQEVQKLVLDVECQQSPVAQSCKSPSTCRRTLFGAARNMAGYPTIIPRWNRGDEPITSASDSVSVSQFPTLTRYVMAKTHDNELAILLMALQLACKATSRACNKAGIAMLFGLAGEVNSTGDDQKKLDVLSNEIFIDALTNCGACSILVSEENEEPIFVPQDKAGRFVVAFDPLDGSSNIDCNVSTGTIFAVYEKTSDKYGAATELVITFKGHGVHRFTLDPSLGEFVHIQAHIKMPEGGGKKIYSCNEGNSRNWDAAIKSIVAKWKDSDKPYAARYVGSMVSDVHRTILYGGIYLYPADAKSAQGKLRVLYEGFPMAFIMEQAGGSASCGLFKGAWALNPQHF
ncbi:CFBP1 [Symbiodinium sp. KB8]|nr:CFBP1 [Symbiodinium sp. KB8]